MFFKPLNANELYKQSLFPQNEYFSLSFDKQKQINKSDERMKICEKLDKYFMFLRLHELEQFFSQTVVSRKYIFYIILLFPFTVSKKGHINFLILFSTDIDQRLISYGAVFCHPTFPL